MKTPPPLPASPARARAWNALWMNLALPGTGSWYAGHRLAGGVQLLLALAGFVATSVYVLGLARVIVQERRLPLELDRRFFLGVAGVTAFLLAWGWSVLGSVAGLRAARSGS